MQQLDNDGTVASWTRSVPSILYSQNKRYVPDFKVHYIDGRSTLEEIKPKQQFLKYGNPEKWAAAEKYCHDNGMSFFVFSEEDLGGVLAIRSFDLGGLQEISPIDKKIRKKAYYHDYYRNIEKQRRQQQKISISA